LIDSSSDEGQKPNEMNGMIELKNVVFRYPSRDEVPVIIVWSYCLFVWLFSPWPYDTLYR